MEIPKGDSVTSVEEYRRFFRHSLMQACLALGSECMKKSRLQEALQYFETFLYVAKQVGGKWETTALGMLGTTLYGMGLTDKAVSHFEALADIAKQNGNKDDEAQAYLHLARCYCHFGQHDKAIRYSEWYLNYSKYNQNKVMKRLEGFAHLTIGYSCFQLQRLEEAFGHYKASLDIAKETDYKELEVKASVALGHFDLQRGRYEEALKYYQTGTAIAKENGDRVNEVLASHHVGVCFFRLSQHEKAVDQLLAVCKMVEKGGYNIGSAEANYMLGQCYFFGLGQYDKAERHLKRAVLFYQELFDGALRQDYYKVSRCEHSIRAYRLLILVLLTQNKAEEGLLVAERGRSKALAELMTTSYSLKTSEANEARALSLSQIREVVKLLDTTVIFFSLLENNDTSIIWSWTIKSNGQVTDMPCGIVSEETTSCEAQASPATLAVKGTNLMSILNETRQVLIKKGRGSGEYEDRSLSFL